MERFPSSPSEWVARAEAIGKDVLRPAAESVDRENRFPHEGVAALRQAGLLSFWLPGDRHGYDGSFDVYWRIAAALGAECLSTAMIWAMHTQQVAVLAAHGGEGQASLLREVAAGERLIASVTSGANGGDVLNVDAPLRHGEDGVRVRRSAPVVSYGEQADTFLVTMRADEGAPTNDVRMVVLHASDGGLEVTGGWNALGMRGTRSVPMLFDTTVPPERVLQTSLRSIVLRTMVPAAHIGWAGCWLGAADGAVRRLVALMRTEEGRGQFDLTSEQVLNRLARLRLQLDLVRALTAQVALEQDELRSLSDEGSGYEDVGVKLRLNNLKIAAADVCYSVAEGLVTLAGLRYGYLETPDLGIERVLRDLRSASLMVHNDRLLKANGKLTLFEHAAPGVLGSTMFAPPIAGELL